ncbi:MAG: hypothetical protein Q8Q88_06440 [Phenylobacterium sp.]|nr:hypothetical protein [Phenylobacterium sp.]MDP3746673.1 hypothetical protein [Phenylobacterium sp.]
MLVNVLLLMDRQILTVLAAAETPHLVPGVEPMGAAQLFLRLLFVGAHHG